MSTETEIVAAPPVDVAEPEWRRLQARTVLVRPFNEFVGFIPLLIGAIALGQHNDEKIWSGLGVITLLLARGVLHWATTRYRTACRACFRPRTCGPTSWASRS